MAGTKIWISEQSLRIVYEYSDFIDSDVAENMTRINFRGIAGHDPDGDNLLSLLIWELKSLKDSSKTESELKWIHAIDPSFIAPLLDGYRTEALSEDVRRTFFG